jgi:hypothetical protein
MTTNAETTVSTYLDRAIYQTLRGTVPFSTAQGAYRATGVRGAMCATFPNMQQLYRLTHEDADTDGNIL